MHEHYLRRAIRLAVKNVKTGRGGPFGALIVKDGKVIARGANHVTPHHDPTAHAEIIAIRQACRSLKSHSLHGAVIYSSCEPCPMCLSAIYWARLDALYFAASRSDAARAGFDDEAIYSQIPLPLEARSLPTLHLSPPDAAQPFTLWLKSQSKIPY